MTTRSPGPPAATPARFPRVLLRASLASLLFTAAWAAMAAPVDDGAPFPTSRVTPAAVADQPAAAKPEPTTAATSLTERALGLAAGVNRLLSPAITPLSLPDTAGEPAKLDGDGKIQNVLQKALALLGTPYRWGGDDPDRGFDCSGLVGYVFRNALGVELPRVSRDMARSGELITDRAKLAAGDLVFFGRKGRVNHVGIYVGEGRFVHAPSRGKDVTVSSLDKGYWSGRFLQARRVTDGG